MFYTNFVPLSLETARPSNLLSTERNGHEALETEKNHKDLNPELIISFMCISNYGRKSFPESRK